MPEDGRLGEQDAWPGKLSSSLQEFSDISQTLNPYPRSLLCNDRHKTDCEFNSNELRL